MPAKNSIKIFVENTYYHIYNRGVEKRDIFLDQKDYKVFLHLLKYYLSEKMQGINQKRPLVNTAPENKPIRPRPLVNLSKEVKLIAYCLMPNHFHLLTKQITKDGMTKLVRAVSTTYALYFNRRYKRQGTLFQGRYKAVMIKDDSYALHLSRYIHLNPIKLVTRTDLVNWPYSSYAYFLGLKKADWINPDIILKLFKPTENSSLYLNFKDQYKNYKDFVEAGIKNPKEGIEKLTIEDE